MFYISNLKINNFRCYSVNSFEFSPFINILFGENAVGKTTIVESIAYLGICKSFKGVKDRDLLKIGAEYFFLNGKFREDDAKEIDIIASYNGKEKKVKKNSYIYNKISDYIGYFNVVTFEPGDLELVKGSPNDRRRFLNVNISQNNHIYLNSLVKYNKILKTRNDYLKSADINKIDEAYFDAITLMLAEEAIILTNIRKTFIDQLNIYIKEASLSISLDKELVNIEYLPNIKENDIKKAFINKEKSDLLQKTTTIGIHRDDFMIRINSSDASIYASQGQSRSAVIAIKLGLSKYLSSENDKQIILLDDVLSELDGNRQERLLDLLTNDKQIFITTTSIKEIDQEILNKSQIQEIKGVK